MTRRARSPRPAALLALAVGIAIVVLYFVLHALQVGGIGQPSDIGGGGILLLGFIVTIGSLVWIVTDLVRGRS